MKQLEHKTYKETTIVFIGNGTMLQTNNDIPFTEEIKQGIAAALYLEHCRKVDNICKSYKR